MVLAVKGWIDPVAWYQALCSQLIHLFCDFLGRSDEDDEVMM